MNFLHASLLLVALFAAGCARPTPEPARMDHIHGLGVDPNDPVHLYVATHHGLFEGRADSASPVFEPVTEEPFDIMGFIIHPSDGDVMYASGHPARPTALDDKVGLVKSTDGGRTWTSLALRNRVDFHALTLSPVDPERIWGYHAGILYRSADGGIHWTQANPLGLGETFGLAASPTRPDVLYAATRAGIFGSTDGGTAWDPFYTAAGATNALAVHVQNASLMLAHFGLAGVSKSTDGGRTWASLDVEAPAGGAVAIAIAPQDPQRLYVAAADGTLRTSADGGQHWTVLHRP